MLSPALVDPLELRREYRLSSGATCVGSPPCPKKEPCWILVSQWVTGIGWGIGGSVFYGRAHLFCPSGNYSYEFVCSAGFYAGGDVGGAVHFGRADIANPGDLACHQTGVSISCGLGLDISSTFSAIGLDPGWGYGIGYYNCTYAHELFEL